MSPTKDDFDKQDEFHSGDTGEVERGTGSKLNNFKRSLVTISIIVIIVICCVFSTLSTQHWFIEWLKNLR